MHDVLGFSKEAVLKRGVKERIRIVCIGKDKNCLHITMNEQIMHTTHAKAYQYGRTETAFCNRSRMRLATVAGSREEHADSGSVGCRLLAASR